MMRESGIDTSAEAHENDAMPRRVDVHTGRGNATEQKPLPDAVTRKPVTQKSPAEWAYEKSPAEWAYERLILYIQNFEAQLDNEHEVAMGFAGGEAGVLRIEGLGFFDPDIVTFYGTDPSGARTQLIQHVSQLSVILRALPKETPAESPRRIGFRLAEELDRA